MFLFSKYKVAGITIILTFINRVVYIRSMIFINGTAAEPYSYHRASVHLTQQVSGTHSLLIEVVLESRLPFRGYYKGTSMIPWVWSAEEESAAEPLQTTGIWAPFDIVIV